MIFRQAPAIAAFVVSLPAFADNSMTAGYTAQDLTSSANSAVLDSEAEPFPVISEKPEDYIVKALDPQRMTPRRLFGEFKELVGDWNGDGHADHAVFAQEPFEHIGSLLILHGKEGGGVELAVYLSGQFKARGEGFGLNYRTGSSFGLVEGAVMSRGTSWARQIVIAYRDDGYVIAGVEESDYVHEDAGRSLEQRCDVNFRTGRVERINWTSGSVPHFEAWTELPSKVMLQDLATSETTLTEACSAVSDLSD